MADLWVMNSQTWLNTNYRDVPGYDEIAVDGSAGWQTMYALTRALQHELGITALSDNFGSGTVTAFNSKVGTITSATTDSGILGILQAALWCKGFAGGAVFGEWSNMLATSVTTMRGHLGLSASSVVDVKLMKSLLTMDAYVLTSGGSPLVRAGQQWLNSHYISRGPFSIIPCDGHFTRDVQRGLMLALQFEIGMSDSVANGNFGPGTQSGLAAQANISTGSTDGSKRFVSLFQLTLAFNRYDVERSGTFNAATRIATLDFQRFLEIGESGNGDYDTWAALLVSTGNPNRPVEMIDTTTALTPSFAAQMRSAGYNVVGRYLTVTGKSIGRGELDIIFDHGFSVVPIFQNYNNGPQYFTREIGYDHGSQAVMRARQLGFRDGVVIFFAVDYDAFASEIEVLLRPYFEGVADGLHISRSVHYRIGVYATRNVAGQLVEKGLAEAIWVSGMSTAYSGNLGFPMPANWWYNQIQEVYSLNIDRNAVSSNAQPATRDLVARTPDQTVESRALHWNIVRQQVLAEKAIVDHHLVPSALASTFVLHYLMRTKYAYGPFKLYAPLHNPGLSMEVQEQINSAFHNYFAVAGLPGSIAFEYEGDLEHLGVVAQGVNYWGDWAGSGAIGVGDLGGWALDLVQLWANYKKFGGGATISDFVAVNLGGGTDETSEFQLPDLISDADGWLVGRDVRSGIAFADSMGEWFSSYPNWVDRLRIFLNNRFAQAGMTLNASIQANVASIFSDAWLWPGAARDAFQERQDDPTVTQLLEFKQACSTYLLQKAGLNPSS